MRRPDRNRPAFRLRHLSQSGHFPSGNPRYYYTKPRKLGGQAIPMPDAPPDSMKFRKAYAEAEAAPVPVRSNALPGSLADAIERFYASGSWQRRAESTRGVWRRYGSDIAALYGTAPLATVRTKNIKTDLSRLDPHPANNRLKSWQAVSKWCEDNGLVDVDPARPIRKRETPKSDGHTAWTRADFESFQRHWPIGTTQRLAFELLYRSCASIVDVVRLGPGMVSEGWLIYERQKSGSLAAVPWHRGTAPEWFEWTDDLEECLASADRHMTFLVTTRGHAKSEKSASQWFSRACTAAGLANLSAHGVRKGRAAMFRENGATTDQRMGVLGHETEGEATFYSKSADLKKVISGTKVPTRTGKLEVFRRSSQ